MDLGLKMDGTLHYFRAYTAFMEDAAMNWITGSGVRGVKAISLPLRFDKQKTAYTVRLYFAEPEDLKLGERVFSVGLQGADVLKDFDIVKEAGGARRSLVKEFKHVDVDDALHVTFTPVKDLRMVTAVISGIEVVAETSAGN